MRSHLRDPFFILFVLLLPVMLVGYVLWIGKAFLTRRASGMSMTAQGPLSARWFQHMLGTRQDELSSRLMMVLPGVPPLGARLVAGPVLLAHRVSGSVPRAFRYPFEGDIPLQYEGSARVAFFDAAVARYVGDLPQLVILGAGFDTRALALCQDPRVRSFEVDAPKTQAIKRETLKKAGIDPNGVTFVAADFEKDDWLARLVDAGFDLHKPALFLWEGVTMYLDWAAVESTLRKMPPPARAPSSRSTTSRPSSSRRRSLYARYARAMTRAGGEPLTFGIDSTPPSSERLAEFLGSCGLSLGEQRTLGQETDGKRAWGGFATAIVK